MRQDLQFRILERVETIDRKNSEQYKQQCFQLAEAVAGWQTVAVIERFMELAKETNQPELWRFERIAEGIRRENLCQTT